MTTMLNLFCLVNVNDRTLFYSQNRKDALNYELDNPEFICIHRTPSDDQLDLIRSTFSPLH